MSDIWSELSDDFPDCGNSTAVVDVRRQLNLIERLDIIQHAGRDPHGRPIIVFTGCRLALPGVLNAEAVWLSMVERLKQVADREYVIVCFPAGMPDESQPNADWFYKVWEKLDTQFKKNMGALYIIHPTLWVRSFTKLIRPFISSDLYSKIHYCCTLKELKAFINPAQLDIAPEILETDETETKRLAPYAAYSRNIIIKPTDKIGFCQQFGVPLMMLVDDEDHIPIVLRSTGDFICQSGITTEDVFLIAGDETSIETYKDQFNDGCEINFAPSDVHNAACLFKTFLRELPEPIMTFDLFDRLFLVSALPKLLRVDEVRAIIQCLPETNMNILKYIMELIHTVSIHSLVNDMTSDKLIMILAPFIAWAPDHKMTLELKQRLYIFFNCLFVNADAIFSPTKGSNPIAIRVSDDQNSIEGGSPMGMVVGRSPDNESKCMNPLVAPSSFSYFGSAFLGWGSAPTAPKIQNDLDNLDNEFTDIPVTYSMSSPHSQKRLGVNSMKQPDALSETSSIKSFFAPIQLAFSRKGSTNSACLSQDGSVLHGKALQDLVPKKIDDAILENDTCWSGEAISFGSPDSFISLNKPKHLAERSKSSFDTKASIGAFSHHRVRKSIQFSMDFCGMNHLSTEI